MIGSSIMVLPVIFYLVGIMTTILVIFLQAVINYLTACILVSHGKSKDDDLSDMIKRLLGRNYFIFYCLISMLLLIFVSVAYFLL